MGKVGVFVGDVSSWEDVAERFGEDVAKLSALECVLASYEIDGYEGSAYVLFRDGGKLYEVVASHCSCNELEGQWEPEETSFEALALRDEPYGVSKEGIRLNPRS